MNWSLEDQRLRNPTHDDLACKNVPYLPRLRTCILEAWKLGIEGVGSLGHRHPRPGCPLRVQLDSLSLSRSRCLWRTHSVFIARHLNLALDQFRPFCHSSKRRFCSKRCRASVSRPCPRHIRACPAPIRQNRVRADRSRKPRCEGFVGRYVSDLSRPGKYLPYLTYGSGH